MKLTSIAYHRNGICGAGFFAITFTDRVDGKTRNFVSTVFMDDEGETGGRYTVLDADLAASGNVRFGENSWRGDHYIDQLAKWISAWRKEMTAALTTAG